MTAGFTQRLDEAGDSHAGSLRLRHGDPGPFDLAAWLDPDDPDLALVTADMDAWHEAHPCECEALCECEDDE